MVWWRRHSWWDQKHCWCQRWSRGRGRRAERELFSSVLSTARGTDFTTKASSSPLLPLVGKQIVTSQGGEQRTKSRHFRAGKATDLLSKAHLQPKQTQPCPLPQQVPTPGFIGIATTTLMSSGERLLPASLQMGGKKVILGNPPAGHKYLACDQLLSIPLT